MGATEPHRSEVEKAEDALAAAWERDTGEEAPIGGSAPARSSSSFHAGCFRILLFADGFREPYSVDDLAVVGRNEKWGAQSGRAQWSEPPRKLCDFTVPRDGGSRTRYSFWVMVKNVARAEGAIP